MGAPTPKISVILPLYRVKTWLPAAIASMKAQTFADWECLCLDDGSGTGMEDLARDLTAGDPRFVVRGFPNAGVAATRNRGLALARGDYVAFLDQDDAYHPRYLERLLAAAERTGADCATCRYQSEPFGNDAPPPPTAAARLVPTPCDWLLETGTARVAIWTKLWRREALGDLRFNPLLYGSDDALFTYAAFARFRSIAVLDEALYFHRRHPQAVSVQNPPRYLFACLRFVWLLPSALPHPLPRGTQAGILKMLADSVKTLTVVSHPAPTKRALMRRILALLRRNGLSVWDWSWGKRWRWWRLCRSVGLPPTFRMPTKNKRRPAR